MKSSNLVVAVALVTVTSCRSQETLYVVKSDAPLLKSADATSEVVAPLAFGERLEIKSELPWEDDGFVLLDTPQRSGWIERSALAAANKAAPAYFAEPNHEALKCGQEVRAITTAAWLHSAEVVVVTEERLIGPLPDSAVGEPETLPAVLERCLWGAFEKGDMAAAKALSAQANALGDRRTKILKQASEAIAVMSAERPAGEKREGYAIILAGTKDEEQAEAELRKRYGEDLKEKVEAFVSVPWAARPLSSSRFPGLNPGFKILVLGVCGEQRQGAAVIEKLQLKGAYLRKVDWHDMPYTCPAQADSLSYPKLESGTHAKVCAPFGAVCPGLVTALGKETLKSAAGLCTAMKGETLPAGAIKPSAAGGSTGNTDAWRLCKAPDGQIVPLMHADEGWIPTHGFSSNSEPGGTLAFQVGAQSTSYRCLEMIYQNEKKPWVMCHAASGELKSLITAQILLLDLNATMGLPAEAKCELECPNCDSADDGTMTGMGQAAAMRSDWEQTPLALESKTLSTGDDGLCVAIKRACGRDLHRSYAINKGRFRQQRVKECPTQPLAAADTAPN